MRNCISLLIAVVAVVDCCCCCCCCCCCYSCCCRVILLLLLLLSLLFLRLPFCAHIMYPLTPWSIRSPCIDSEAPAEFSYSISDQVAASMVGSPVSVHRALYNNNINNNSDSTTNNSISNFKMKESLTYFEKYWPCD